MKWYCLWEGMLPADICWGCSDWGMKDVLIVFSYEGRAFDNTSKTKGWIKK